VLHLLLYVVIFFVVFLFMVVDGFVVIVACFCRNQRSFNKRIIVRPEVGLAPLFLLYREFLVCIAMNFSIMYPEKIVFEHDYLGAVRDYV